MSIEALDALAYPSTCPWPELRPVPDTRSTRRLKRRGRRHIEVYVRVQPEDGRLDEFAEALFARMKVASVVRLPEHRAMWLFFNALARDHGHAISQVDFMTRRTIRKIGVPVVRVSFDARDAGEQFRPDPSNSGVPAHAERDVSIPEEIT